MQVNDDYSRHAWVYFLNHESDAGKAFRKFLVEPRTDGMPSKVEIVRSDNRGKFSMVSLESCANSVASRRNSPTPTTLNRTV